MLAVSLELEDPFDLEVISALAQRRRDHMHSLLRDCRFALAEVITAGHPGTVEQVNRAWELLERMQVELLRFDQKQDLWSVINGGLIEEGAS